MTDARSNLGQLNPASILSAVYDPPLMQFTARSQRCGGNNIIR